MNSVFNISAIGAIFPCISEPGVVGGALSENKGVVNHHLIIPGN